MRNTLLMAMAALVALSILPASAQQSREQKSDKSAVSLPLRPKAAANPCAEYGPGFVRVEGSPTCIKIGGSISVGAGATR
jgi:hypothetical protein